MYDRLWSALLIIAVIYGANAKKSEVDFDIDSVLCENRLTAFFVTDNADVSVVPSKEIVNVTEEKCRQICADNRDGDGRHVICASFSYDHVIFKCAIYRRRSEPDGNLEKIDAPGKRYFEKFCLNETIPKECADRQFLRVDETVLFGYANAATIVPTMADCANECMKQGKSCKSAMYFYKEGECITNLESARTKPQDFHAPDDDDDDKVVYFDNGCLSVEESEDVNDNMMGVSKQKPLEDEKMDTKKFNTEQIKEKIDEQIEKIMVDTDTGNSNINETMSGVNPLNETFHSIEPSKEISVKKNQKHPKDITNHLYGAKQLMASENGTISVVDSDTKDETDNSKKLVFKVDKSPNSKELPVSRNDESTPVPKINALKTKVVKSTDTKSLQIQRIIAPAVEPEEDGFFSKWGDWTPCTEPGERKIRRRKCLDLKKCRGALMQVDWCPKSLPTTEEPVQELSEPVGPVQNPIPIARSSAEGSPPAILPPQMPRKNLKPLPEGAPGGPDDVWSPWLGVCQHFASTQPCNNHEVIGFESRECIAKDPKACKGPFFRYCTLPC